MDFFIIGIILAVIFIVLVNYVFFYDRKKFRYRKNLPPRQKVPAAVPSPRPGEGVPAEITPEKGWDRDTTPIAYTPVEGLPSALPSSATESHIPSAAPSFKPEEYVFAGFYRRFGAFLIDITIIYLLVYFALVNLKLTSLFEVAIFPVIILYFTYYDAGLSRLKASIGKRLLSIVVVNSQFQRVSLRESFERALIKTIIFWLFTSPFAWIALIILFLLTFIRWKSPTFSRYQLALWDKNLTLWDMIVNTRVVFDPDKEWVNVIPQAETSHTAVHPDRIPTKSITSPEPVQTDPGRSGIIQYLSDKRIIAIIIVFGLVLAVIGLGSAYYKPDVTAPPRVTGTPRVSVSPSPQSTSIVPTRTTTRIPTIAPTLGPDAAVTVPFQERIPLNANTVTRSFQTDTAPIFISLNTDPKMITDRKVIFRSPSDMVGTEQEITRPDENAYSTIIVRDLTSGGIVAEDGYGKQYSSETFKVIRILKEGRYKVEISGSRVTVTLAISRSPAETPSVQLTKTSTPAASRPDTSWISATVDKSEYVVGGVVTVSGTVSGTTGPVVYSVYTLEDVKGNNYSNPLSTGSINPSTGGTYKTAIILDPKNLPVGSYVIILKIPSGQTTKLQFLVSAPGVNCTTICNQVYSTAQYHEGLQYNDKGEAVCYC